jgi:hypothetical protein
MKLFWQHCQMSFLAPNDPFIDRQKAFGPLQKPPKIPAAHHTALTNICVTSTLQNYDCNLPKMLPTLAISLRRLFFPVYLSDRLFDL